MSRWGVYGTYRLTGWAPCDHRVELIGRCTTCWTPEDVRNRRPLRRRRWPLWRGAGPPCHRPLWPNRPKRRVRSPAVCDSTDPNSWHWWPCGCETRCRPWTAGNRPGRHCGSTMMTICWPNNRPCRFASVWPQRPVAIATSSPTNWSDWTANWPFVATAIRGNTFWPAIGCQSDNEMDCCRRRIRLRFCRSNKWTTTCCTTTPTNCRPNWPCRRDGDSNALDGDAAIGGRAVSGVVVRGHLLLLCCCSSQTSMDRMTNCWPVRSDSDWTSISSGCVPIASSARATWRLRLSNPKQIANHTLLLNTSASIFPTHTHIQTAYLVTLIFKIEKNSLPLSTHTQTQREFHKIYLQIHTIHKQTEDWTR